MGCGCGENCRGWLVLFAGGAEIGAEGEELFGAVIVRQQRISPMWPCSPLGCSASTSTCRADLDRRAHARKPDQTVNAGGRTYSLYYAGQHLTVVAWFEHGAVYWVHNSLTDTVQNGELLAIAERTEPVGTPGHPGSPIAGNRSSGGLRLRAVVVPTRAGVVAQTSLGETIGAIAGVLTLIVVPLLGFALLRRRRDPSELRGQLQATRVVESRLRSKLEGRRLG